MLSYLKRNVLYINNMSLLLRLRIVKCYVYSERIKEESMKTMKMRKYICFGTIRRKSGVLDFVSNITEKQLTSYSEQLQIKQIVMMTPTSAKPTRHSQEVDIFKRNQLLLLIRISWIIAESNTYRFAFMLTIDEF